MTFRVVIAIISLFLSIAAHASEKRVALVIGNSSYKSAPVLDNTLNDAELISASLKAVGFEVLDGRDLSKDGMGKILGRFAKKLQGADAGLVYYAGHGLQFEGENYLLPIDAAIDDEFGLRFEATRMDDVISVLHYAGGVQILILDACRNNPFLGRLARRGMTRDLAVRGGLAPIVKTQGMLIAYATQANDVASDGEGRNGPFAEALAREIGKPGQEIATVFRNVQRQVHKATQGQQFPELSVSLLGEFYINAGETDVDAWKKLSVSTDREQLEAFIKKYPDSGWASVAKMRLSELAEKAQFLREFAQREQLILELNNKAEKLGEKIKEAERKRDKAMEQLDDRIKTSSLSASGADEGNNAGPEAQSKSEQERLATTVQEQQTLVLTLSEERRRIDAEKKAAEQNWHDRLDGKSQAPVIAPLQDTIVARPPKPPANLASPESGRKTAASKCADVLSRLQLGEHSQSDIDALKHCQH